MAYTIMMATDFGASAKNATRYALAFTQQQATTLDLEYVLLHIYSLPLTSTAEGIAVVAINDDYVNAERELEEELDWIHANYPDLKVRSMIITDGVHDGLASLVGNGNDVLVVMGAAGEYDDLLSWDNEILNSLRNLKAPVLLVPRHITYEPLESIGYACNYKNINSHIPFDRIIEATRLAGDAKLKVVYVDTPAIHEHVDADAGEALLKASLAPVSPEYFTLHDTHVIDAIGQFATEEHIGMMVIVPRKHGIWDSLFHRSNTKALARLNKLPILALREQ